MEFENARLKDLLNMDGTNHGIPTSQTPINKEKVIPNTREKSDKAKGGQVGHKKHKLEKFKDKEENQYGPQVQALELTLMNQANVTMNKAQKITKGLTNGEIDLSEGYIAKLQKRASDKLYNFMREMKTEIIKQPVLHWDDTVIMVNKKRSCLRFYGTEKLAMYTAHAQKDKNGLDEDGILNVLSKETIVEHDHNKVNYNDDYYFKNAECNVHLIRDLKKVIDNLDHKWSKKLIDLLTKMNISYGFMILKYLVCNHKNIYRNM